ncbi:hypothetical protein WIW49_16955 [Xanthomonas euroxanthea]
MFDNGLLWAAEVVVTEDAAEQFVGGEDIRLGYRAGQALAGVRRAVLRDGASGIAAM